MQMQNFSRIRFNNGGKKQKMRCKDIITELAITKHNRQNRFINIPDLSKFSVAAAVSEIFPLPTTTIVI